ncbi:MAG: hypothetical protein AMXMBFR84_05710 [Candidatus Hydrogenedentota bacterium]
MSKRLFIIGLDCADPQFIFGSAAFKLPNLNRLMTSGAYGPIRSCDPPITVPAWSVLFSGKDPGELGCYGFRNRVDHSYAPMVNADASWIQTPRLWDTLSRRGLSSIVVGVPQTYPPKPVKGWLVSGPETPDDDADCTYPKILKQELLSSVGELLFDVHDFRNLPPDRLIAACHRLMQNRFAVTRHLMDTKPWDACIMVEMGLDRMHHALWQYCVSDHPRFEANSPYSSAFKDYYTALDTEIGSLLDRVAPDTRVLTISDHGAQAMRGGFNINQWLINEGLLVLKDSPHQPTSLDMRNVDWSHTTAWAAGGYYARLFLNIEGREPDGIILQDQREATLDRIANSLGAITKPDDSPLRVTAHKPESLYREVNGVAPDFLVYFEDLAYRALGSIGISNLFSTENDTGPDGANHAPEGIAIFHNIDPPPKPWRLQDIYPLLASL